jgi:hypothetical protein
VAAAPAPLADVTQMPARRVEAKTAPAPEPVAAGGAAGRMAAAPMAANRLALRGDSDKSQVLERVMAKQTDRAVAPRCFEFADSAPANIPSRFTLDTTRLSPNRRARAVSVPGAGDALARLGNGHWVQTTPAFTDVYWSADETLRLQIPSSNDNVGRVRATLWQGERATSVQLRRCDR